MTFSAPSRICATGLRRGRDILLDGRPSDRLFPTTGRRGAEGIHPNNVRDMIYAVSERAIGDLAPPEKRLVRRLKPHQFRDILATAVLKRTGNPALAADAIHISVKTLLAHSGRFLVEDRGPRLRATIFGLLHDVDDDLSPDPKPGGPAARERGNFAATNAPLRTGVGHDLVKLVGETLMGIDAAIGEPLGRHADGNVPNARIVPTRSAAWTNGAFACREQTVS